MHFINFPNTLFSFARKNSKFAHWCCKGIDWLDLSSLLESDSLMDWKKSQDQSAYFSAHIKSLINLRLNSNYGGSWVSFRGFESNACHLDAAKKNESKFFSVICADALMWLFVSTDEIFSEKLAEMVNADECGDNVVEYYKDMLFW